MRVLRMSHCFTFLLALAVFWRCYFVFVVCVGFSCCVLQVLRGCFFVSPRVLDRQYFTARSARRKKNLSLPW